MFSGLNFCPVWSSAWNARRIYRYSRSISWSGIKGTATSLRKICFICGLCRTCISSLCRNWPSERRLPTSPKNKSQSPPSSSVITTNTLWWGCWTDRFGCGDCPPTHYTIRRKCWFTVMAVTLGKLSKSYKDPQPKWSFPMHLTFMYTFSHFKPSKFYAALILQENTQRFTFMTTWLHTPSRTATWGSWTLEKI